MDERLRLSERLRTVQHFTGLPLKDLMVIVSSGQVRRFRQEENIFEEGAPCAGMHVLMAGKVNLCKYGPQGQLNIIATIDPVIMFNEVAVLDGGPNPVCAVAVENSHIWRISYEGFQGLLNRYPQVGLSLLRVLARRQRQMLEQYEDISFRSVQSRVAKLLLELSLNGQQPIERRLHSISDMAARIATVPEAISRVLNTLNKNGMINSDRTTIVVIAPAALAELAQIPPI